MNLEIGKLYRRIDSGWLYYKDTNGMTSTVDIIDSKPIFLFLGSEYKISIRKENVMITNFLINNRVCYATFSKHHEKLIEDGKIFEEIK